MRENKKAMKKASASVQDIIGQVERMISLPDCITEDSQREIQNRMREMEELHTELVLPFTRLLQVSLKRVGIDLWNAAVRLSLALSNSTFKSYHSFLLLLDVNRTVFFSLQIIIIFIIILFYFVKYKVRDLACQWLSLSIQQAKDVPSLISMVRFFVTVGQKWLNLIELQKAIKAFSEAAHLLTIASQS